MSSCKDNSPPQVMGVNCQPKPPWAPVKGFVPASNLQNN